MASDAAVVPVTIIVPTKNEAANLSACLQSVRLASEIIVVDSASDDGTPQIAAEWGAKVHQFALAGNYPKKRQWALDNLPLSNEWVLLLDADEQVSEALWTEIATIVSSAQPRHAAYVVKKEFHFLGRRFVFGGFSFGAVVLGRRSAIRFERLPGVPGDSLDMEVHERVIVSGTIGQLSGVLIHRDFKGLTSYIGKHNAYATWEAYVRHRFRSTGVYGGDTICPSLIGNTQERRRALKLFVCRLPCESLVWFIYHYFVRLGALEGYPGLIACQQRMHYIQNVRAKVFELERSSAIAAGEGAHVNE